MAKETDIRPIPKIAKTRDELTSVYETPDENSPVVKIVGKGTEFRVAPEESTDDFTAIVVVSDIAYVKTDLLDIKDDPAFVAHTAAGSLGAK